jgi:hypothetical protein
MGAVRGREELQSDEDSRATLWAQPEVAAAGECCQEVAAVGRLGQQWRAGRSEQLAAESEFGLAMAVGQEAVVTNAWQAGRQNVLEEAADELLGRDGHHLGLPASR